MDDEVYTEEYEYSTQEYLYNEVSMEVNENISSEAVYQPILYFSNELNVRSYLCSHRFSSSDGYTLSFYNMAYEMQVNGIIIYTYLDIIYITSFFVVMKARGPYGDGTLKLYVLGSNSVIEDISDKYYSQ